MTTSKKAVAKQTTKATAKPATKLLSEAQRSAVMTVAGFKAHCHKRFQAKRTPSERKEQIALYVQAKREFVKRYPALADRVN
jgi:hypothetical protein